MYKQFLIICFIFISTSAKAHTNIKFPTIGGKVFWTDIKVINGWRIQKNVITGHCRLLNPRKIRYQWGSKDSCLNEMSKHTKVNSSKKTVILIHGLGCRTESLNCLIPMLQKEGFQTVQFGYSTLFEPLEQCAEKLNSVIQEYDGEIYTVTHSMGGILLRQYQKNYKREISATAMLAPPNNGAKIVDFLAKAQLDWLLGVNGKRLNTSATGLPKSLPSLKAPFITIAGTKKSPVGHFPILGFSDLDNDGFVSAETTHLEGELEHYNFKAHHLSIMKNKDVQKTIINFLNRDTE